MFLILIIDNKTAFWRLSPFHVVIPFFLVPPFFWNCEDTDILSTHIMLMRYVFLAKHLSFPCMDNSVPGLGIFPKHQEANQKALIPFIWGTIWVPKHCAISSQPWGKLGQWKGWPRAPISVSPSRSESRGSITRGDDALFLTLLWKPPIGRHGILSKQWKLPSDCYCLPAFNMSRLES